MVDCTFYFLSLPLHVSAAGFLGKVSSDVVLISGVPHGWVLEPHSVDAKSLLNHKWNLFILTRSSTEAVDLAAKDQEVKLVKGGVSIPQAQYDQLLADINKPATPSKDTPLLPREWNNGQTGRVPDRHVLPAKAGPLAPGELKLYDPTASFLSTTLTDAVRDKPVSLFNLFKYRNGDPSVHEHYMQGFKEKFGPAAGAQLKFMGPVCSQPRSVDPQKPSSESVESEMSWQDANIVQYDSIWHYAYMLSTDVYQELNKEKIEGLDDTCILLISEVELRQ